MSSDHETPALIAAAIGRGDKQAETLLFQKYYKQMLYILERKTGNTDLAQDLCQEAFCIVLERLRSKPLEEPEKLAAFLHTTASNLHIADIRKAQRRKTFADQQLLDHAADPTQNQYQALLKERASAAVRQLVVAMDNPRDSKLLYSFYIEEKEKPEICAELNLSLRHFDKVLFRAKQRFRALVLQRNDKN